MGVKSKILDTNLGGGDSGVGSGSGTAGATSKMARLKLSEEERKKLQDMIKRAGSLQEIIRLEKMLNEGRLPSGITAGDEMEE